MVAGSPVASAAAAVSPGSTVVVETSSGNCSTVIPASCRACGSQASVCRSISPVPEAIEWSVTRASHSRSST
jgi:hypothetical protein